MDLVKRRRTPFNGKDGQYPPDMDKDMIPLCDALNSLAGVRTFFCCSGHGRGREGEFYISMGCSNMRSFRRIVESFNNIRNRVPAVWKPYTLEPEYDFWPLRKNEVGVRVSNKCVDHLDARRRKKEFDGVIRLLCGGAR